MTPTPVTPTPKSTRNRRVLLFGATAAIIAAVSLWVSSTALLNEHPELISAALTLDCTLLLGASYYWLFVRTKHASAVTIAPVIFIGALFADALVDTPSFATQAALWVAGVAEIVVFLFALFTAKKVRWEYLQHRQLDKTVTLAAELALRQHLKLPIPLARFVAFDFAFIRAALVGWRDPMPAFDDTRRFATFNRSGWKGIFAFIMMAVVFEGIALHFLLHAWKPAAAYVHLALSIYGLIWLIGDFQSVRRSVLELSAPGDEPNRLDVRIGTRWSASIPCEHVECVVRGEPAGAQMRFDGRNMVGGKVEGYLPLVVAGKPTLHLVLREPVEVAGPFGMRRSATIVGLAPDASDAFVAELKARI